MNTDNLVVAVSYAHDSDEFNKKVVAFVSCLREKHGYDAIMDEYLKQKETAVDFNEMMAKMIPNANKVIVLLTPKYKERADQFIGGVGDEYRNIKQYLLAALYNAPLTISNYYQAMYNNDHANGLV